MYIVCGWGENSKKTVKAIGFVRASTNMGLRVLYGFFMVRAEDLRGVIVATLGSKANQWEAGQVIVSLVTEFGGM